MMELFQQLGLYFDQDIFVIYSSVEDAASAFIGRLNANQTAELAQYLERSLSSKTDAELGIMWDKTGSDILVSDEGIRAFLSKILAQAKNI